MKKLLAILLTLSSLSAYAQESTVSVPDKEWGEHQNFEARAAYWRAIEMSGPDTNIAEARIRGYNQFMSIPRPKQMMIQSVSAWEQVGGSQSIIQGANGTVSGRPTAIAFDPKDNSTLYLGTSGGGLWKTKDGGNTWANLSDSWSSYAMGGVAVDYSDNQTIYAATGDLYDRTGDGLYKSTDGGLNWTHSASAAAIGSQCNQVLIDPLVHTTIYITGSSGVYRSLDAGSTWKRVLGIGGTTHMVIDPTNGQNLYAAGGGVIRKSTDGGTTWGSPDLASNISGKSTITLAISKKDVSKIYASIGSVSGGSAGLARSDDSGATWSLVWDQDNYMSRQSFYNNACAVNPSNANYVVVGGLDIWGSNNGGSTLQQRTQWTAGSSSSNFSHADVHVLTYGPLGLYALSDGGLFFSGNNGISWQQNKNNKLSTLLFVGGDAAPDFSYVVGGAQDNGINRARETDKTFVQTHGGDGGRCFISQSDGQSVYSTYIQASLQKSGDYGNSWNTGGDPGDPYNIIPVDCPLLNESVPFYMNYDVSESDGAVLAIAGGTNVYYSNDGATSLYKITTSSTVSGGPRTVHVAGADANVVYAGGGSGYVSVTQNAGEITGVTWVKSTTKVGTVSGFVTDPNDASHVWTSISGYGSGMKHFWRSTDFGKTWESPATNLPDLDASTIARAPNGDLFLGTTFGVLYSKDNGITWAPLRDGMPLCQVTKLRVRGTSNQWLLATTYGRGMFRININDLPPVVANNAVSASTPSPDMPAISSINPNPVHINSKVTIGFTLAKEGVISLILFDELGREVKTLAKEYLAGGQHSSEADLSTLNSGVYYAVLTSDGHAVTQRLVIAK